MSHDNLLLVARDSLLQALLVDMFIDARCDVFPLTHCDPLSRADQGMPDIAIISGGPGGAFAAGWRRAGRLSDAYATLPRIMLSTKGSAVEEVGQSQRDNLFVAAL